MKKKNKWGKHPKKYRPRRFYFPRLDLLSMDGLGDYSRAVEEDENSIFSDLRKYRFYDIVNSNKQV